MPHRHRVLVISKNSELRYNLVTLLSGYGYFVEEANTRLEGIKKFRAHKQPILIMDLQILRKFTERLFRLIMMIQKNAIVLITADKKENERAFKQLDYGAYDVLQLPLKANSLIYSIKRAQHHHQTILEGAFVKNVLFFGLLLMPLWVLSLYLLLK